MGKSSFPTDDLRLVAVTTGRMHDEQGRSLRCDHVEEWARARKPCPDCDEDFHSKFPGEPCDCMTCRGAGLIVNEPSVPFRCGLPTHLAGGPHLMIRWT